MQFKILKEEHLAELDLQELTNSLSVGFLVFYLFFFFFRSTILQQQFNRTGKVEHGSVALPAVMRSGSSGPETFNIGIMPSPQQQVTVGQMHRGHMPPLVRNLLVLYLKLFLHLKLVCAASSQKEHVIHSTKSRRRI